MSSPTEDQIFRKANGLSDGDFHRLAEVLAEREFGFQRVVPEGRTFTGRAIGGADAYQPTTRGRRILEATVSSEKKNVWRSVRGVLRAIADARRGDVATLLHVSLADATEEKAKEVLQDDIARAGLSPDQISFVFRKELVRVVARPKFADIWADWGLPASSRPFQLIARAPIFGTTDLLSLRPTLKEYRTSEVNTSPEFCAIEHSLNTTGYARIAGKGAVGKTTLAVDIALRHQEDVGPAYYVDLQALQDDLADQQSGALLDVAATRTANNVMFVLDNVHLAPAATLALSHEWEARGDGSRLLLVGRTASEPPYKSAQSSLDQQAPVTLELAATLDGIARCERRLTSRVAGEKGASASAPEVLACWLNDFGGDLVAFSVALGDALRRNSVGKGLLRSDSLRQEDAREYVEREYLDLVGRLEVEAICRMAALSTLELLCQSEWIAPVPEAEKRGIALRITRGRRVLLQLPHPKLGELLLSVMSRDPNEVLASLVRDHPASIPIVLSRSADSDVAVLRDAVWSMVEGSLLDVIVPPDEVAAGLGWTAEAFRSLWNSFDSPAERSILKHGLRSCAPQLARYALRTPLDLLLHYLDVIETIDEDAAASTSHFVQSSEFCARIAAQIRDTPLNLYVSILAKSRRLVPALYSAIADELQGDEAIDAALEELSARSDLCAVSPIVDQMRMQSRQRHHALRRVAKRILGETVSEKWLDAMLRSVLRSDLAHTVEFLPRLRAESPFAASELEARLIDSDVLGELVEACYTARLQAAAALLSDPVLGAPVAAAMSLERWQTARSSRLRDDAYTRQLSFAAYRLGRPDIAYAAAYAAVRRRNVDEWPADSGALPHLTAVVAWSNWVSPEDLARFISEIATDDWLAAAVRNVSAGTLAMSLYSAWGAGCEPLIVALRGDRVADRVRSFTQSLATAPLQQIVLWDEVASATAIIGGASLVGIPLRQPEAGEWEWLHTRPLASLLRFLFGEADVQLDALRSAFLVGLHWAVDAYDGAVSISPHIGARMLRMCLDAKPTEMRRRELNAAVIGWLEASRSRDWTLAQSTPWIEI